MREKDIEKAVCDYVKSVGGIAYKFTSPARVGVPDRLILLPNVPMFFIEFKAPGGKLTSNQVREIERIRERGTSAFIVDDIDTGKGLIDILKGGFW